MHAWQKKRIPPAVLLAGCFLLFACLMFARENLSAKRQAENWVEALYTVSRQLDMEDWLTLERPELYEERFGSRMNERGAEALQQCGLPYVILLQDHGAPVERSHVTEILLNETADAGKRKRHFHYEVHINVTMEKGINVLAPVEEQSYSGTITLEKNGFFGWKLDGFTLGV